MKTRLLLSSLLFVALAMISSAKDAPLNQELVGKTAPAFTLKNQNDEDISLSQFKDKKNVVLIFSRASW